jgi:hypothetical protein
MLFQVKYILKSNCNHISKHTLNRQINPSIKTHKTLKNKNTLENLVQSKKENCFLFINLFILNYYYM